MRTVAAVVVAVLLLPHHVDAAPRRRPVVPTSPLAVGPEMRVGSSRVVAGAAGQPLSAATNGRETGVIWRSPSYDQVFAGLWQEGSSELRFGTLVPSGLTAQVATNGRTFVVAWLADGAVRTALLTSRGLLPAATIAVRAWQTIAIASDGERYLVAGMSHGTPLGDGRYTAQLLDADAQPIGSTFELAGGEPCVSSGSIAGRDGAFVAAIALDDCAGSSARSTIVRRVERDGRVGPAHRLELPIARLAWPATGVYATVAPAGAISRVIRLSNDFELVEETRVPDVIQLLAAGDRPLAIARGADQSTVRFVWLDATQPSSGGELALPQGALIEAFAASPDGLAIVAGRQLCRWCSAELVQRRWTSDLRFTDEAAVFSRVEAQENPSVTAVGSGYALAWEQERAGLGRRISYARFEADQWSPAVDVADVGLNQRQPATASVGDVLAVAFEERSDDWQQSRVAASIVDADGETTRVEVVEGATLGTIATNGRSFLLLYVNLTHEELRARAMEVDGRLGAEHVVATGRAGFGELSAAWDGRQYVVAHYRAEQWAPRASFQYALNVLRLDDRGAVAGAELPADDGTLSSNANGVALATLDDGVQLLYRRDPWLEIGGRSERGILRRMVSPSIGAPDPLASYAYYPVASRLGSSMLAAWIVPYQAIAIAALAPWGGPGTVYRVPGYIPFDPAVALAARGHHALVVYARRMAEEGFGSGSQLMVRSVRASTEP